MTAPDVAGDAPAELPPLPEPTHVTLSEAIRILDRTLYYLDQIDHTPGTAGPLDVLDAHWADAIQARAEDEFLPLATADGWAELWATVRAAAHEHGVREPSLRAVRELLSRLRGKMARSDRSLPECAGETTTLGAVARALRTDQQGPPRTDELTRHMAKAYLLSWPEILAALNLKNEPEWRDRVRHLNDGEEGPIIFPKQGAQPKVDRVKLLAWWNGLEERWRETQRRQEDRRATVANQYDHGPSATVVPDISGSVRSRRKESNR